MALAFAFLFGVALASAVAIYIAADWLEDHDERWRTEKAPEVV